MTDRNTRLLREANDPLLRPLIDAADNEEERRRVLDEILAQVRPVIQRVIRRQARSDRGIRDQDTDDIAAIVTVRLVDRLQEVPYDIETAIERLQDFAATLTYNAVYDFLRSRYPERTRLKNRIRHAVARDPRLATWTATAGIACGPASTKGADLGAPSTIEIATPSREMLDRTNVGDAVYAIVIAARRPLLLDDVVRALAALWNVSDAAAAADAEPDVEATQLLQAQHRQYLERLWREIRELKPAHRAALLLNLREEESGNAIALLVMVGIATIDEVADALGMTAERLGELWNNLPLDDLTIASMLGVSRQQVINYRRTAREKLARRLGNQ
ncbi:MAG: hypothetical protein M3P06_21000 [Acidobacteriota bacterium]|nr:hypothetical protein [Acidobacteriota bacterium]